MMHVCLYVIIPIFLREFIPLLYLDMVFVVDT